MDADAFVVIDQLRATTTIAALFGAGLRRLTAVDDIGAARRLAAEQGALLLGEVDALPPAGFDYGNSPVDAAAAPAAGRDAVLFTSNGTRALCALGDRAAVFTGALANVSTVTRALAPFERVVLVCAGNEHGERFSLEDAAAAAAITHQLLRAHPATRCGDAARLLVAAMPGRDAIATFAASSFHARGISAKGLGGDVSYALRPDTSPAAPRVVACGAGFAVLEDRAR
ncbi:MAG: 2-phosphosulfolactate phosphatase [Dehalococcoidia bacterium]|nr:2-phosphosulfolactate phosphatase [Dehalococcoidia bacterium]